MQLRSEVVLGLAPAQAAVTTGAPRVTRGQVDELVAAYVAGEGVQVLAGRFGVARSTVSVHLKAAGVLRSGRRLDDRAVARAAQLYATGWSLQRVADELGCAPNTVRSALLGLGVVLRRRTW